ncbi:BnaCnng32510D [Brassica napus]|uniref:BnaCnng32510D protein n=1 Tax=Brassica napus TaxID=3708 RepID=A0A078J2S1_BRANA|nr:BnaCnng32510D [Brassica napus]
MFYLKFSFLNYIKKNIYIPKDSWILVKGFTGIGCGKRETRPESNVRPILRTCFNVERGGCLPQTISLTFYFP